MHHPTTRVAQLMVAVAFAAVSFAGVRATAQAAASTAPVGTGIPAAPAGGIDPSKLPDIQGIHLGMTAQEMLPKLQALYPGKGGPSQFGVNAAPVQYIKAPNPRWTGDLYGTSGTTSDKFTATFTGPPNKQVAVYLMRTLGFQSGKYPLPDTLIASLKIGIGGELPLLPCHTTGQAGPHPAVREVEVSRGGGFPVRRPI